MKEVRYFFVPDASAHNELPNEEGQHATRVLRLEAGDEVFLMDGVGQFYRAVLTLVTQKRCLYEITETLPQAKAWSGRIHLAIAPTKNIDRIEWIAEKCSEIGWDELSFLHCKFSERKQLRTDRIEKIIVSAVKQSRKPFMPTVNELHDFNQFVSQNRQGRKFICHCYDEIEKSDLFHLLNDMDKDDDITILVGPEGDFSIDEVRFALQNGYESVTLGNFRLRTETAGLMAVTMAQLSKRK
ncbi:MAG: RsmE family RNA methyltransferase [Prevotella sp.]